MIIVKIHAGLANQMFQYALGRRLSLLRSDNLLLDINSYENGDYTIPRQFGLQNFNIQVQIANSKQIFSVRGNELQWLGYKLSRKFGFNWKPKYYYHEKETNIYDEALISGSGSIYLDGYWQTEKYLLAIRDILLQDFTLSPQALQPPQRYIDAITKNLSVSVHIRRGDYISSPLSNKHQGVCSIDYYQKACDLIHSKFPGANFFIFSDDLAWCRQNLNFGYTMIFIDGTTDYQDLMLMKLCQHNIIQKDCKCHLKTLLLV